MTTGALTVTTRTRRTRLAAVEAIVAELGLTPDPGMTDLVDSLLRAATGSIESYCRRSFFREQISETLPTDGSQFLMLGRTPVVTTPTIMLSSEPVVDFSLDTPDSGILYRADGWASSQRYGFQLTPIAIPDAYERPLSATYWAGFLVPDDNLIGKRIAAVAADKSFNLTAPDEWPLLVAGDLIETSTFSNAANNGRFTVVSRTATKVVVAEAVVEEPVPGNNDLRTVMVETLPGDVRRACELAARISYQARRREPGVTWKQVGDLSISYSAKLEPNASGTGLPLQVVEMLAPWRRMA